MRIELKGVSKSFTEQKSVLNNITLKEDFEALAIIGPSGGGKSTLLRVLGGLISPSEGEVFLDGTKINYEEKHLVEHRRNIGFVFQSKGLFGHLTGRQNITMPLIKVHGYARDQAEDVAGTLLKRFGLYDDGYKFPHELSGGQQQRIAIARAISFKPNLLLLDEPTSALDPELTSEVLDMVRELEDEGLNIILVTHEMGFAKKACDRILFLVNGELLESGSSADLFGAPKTPELSAFLGKILEWNV